MDKDLKEILRGIEIIAVLLILAFILHKILNLYTTNMHTVNKETIETLGGQGMDVSDYGSTEEAK